MDIEIIYVRRIRGVTKMGKIRNVQIRQALEVVPLIDHMRENS